MHGGLAGAGGMNLLWRAVSGAAIGLVLGYAVVWSIQWLVERYA